MRELSEAPLFRLVILDDLRFVLKVHLVLFRPLDILKGVVPLVIENAKQVEH